MMHVLPLFVLPSNTILKCRLPFGSLEPTRSAVLDLDLGLLTNSFEPRLAAVAVVWRGYVVLVVE